MRKNTSKGNGRKSESALPTRQAGFIKGVRAPISGASSSSGKSLLIPVIAGTGLVVAGYIAYQGIAVYNLSARAAVGIGKVKVLKSNLLTEGLRIGISITISNPTTTTVSFSHPTVDFGKITETQFRNTQTGAVQILKDFKPLVQSLPKKREPYEVLPLQRITTDYIEFTFPPMTMISMLGSVNWLGMIAALMSNLIGIGDKAKMIKKMLLNDKYGIKPYFYVGAIPAPLPVIRF